MSTYRRSRLAGATYFFTVVTAGREPVLCGEAVRRALREAIRQTQSELPFEVVAWVLLPDHLHCLWRLPERDAGYSMRWNIIKGRTTRTLGLREARTDSGVRRRDGRLWQRRFWEHTIRDELDLQRHTDYVHWNPVRQGLVDQAAEWPYSTFHRYCRLGLYPSSWAGGFEGAATETAGE
jgi:putative transposase